MVEADHWETIEGSKPIEIPCILGHYVVDVFMP